MTNMKTTRLLRAVACVLLGTAAIGSSGCLLIAAGAAGGAAAGVAYARGKVCAMYSAYPADVWSALHLALQDLKMPVKEESFDGKKGMLKTISVDGDKVTIHLSEDNFYAGGPLGTRLCIRMGVFGDRPGSEGIFEQIGKHMVPREPQALPGPQPLMPTAASNTVPPPLAPLSTNQLPAPAQAPLPASPLPVDVMPRQK